MFTDSIRDLSCVEVRLAGREEVPKWRALMEEHHYLGDCANFGESLRYVATLEGEWVALIGWGSAALKVGVRDRWIGWNEERKYQRLRYIANNVRFLILPWCRIKNLASRVLGLNLQRLNVDWWERHGHRLVLAETFVDESRNKGTCYRAAGWTELGRTRGFAKKRGSYVAHGNPKLMFVKCLNPQVQEILCSDFPHPYCRTNKDNIMKLNLNAIDFDGTEGLKSVLKTITDPRKHRGRRHKILSLLAAAACATLAGMRGYSAIAQWVKALPNDLLRKLGFRLGIAPSLNSFWRVLKGIDEVEFERKITEWFVKHHAPLNGKGIAVDGKTLRGAYDGDKKAPHLLSAVIHQTGVVLAQKEVGEKTNEIPEARNLLQPLPLTGAIVTLDAMHTQVKTAEFIVEDKKADYVFTVKDNQPTLLEEILSLSEEAFSPSADCCPKGSRSH